MSFAAQVAKSRGQPATVRIGVVTSVIPPQVTVQGTVLAQVGFLDGYSPSLGDNVAVLGQSAVSADGSSWLVVGAVEAGAGAPLVGYGRLIAWYERMTSTAAAASPVGVLRLDRLEVPANRQLFILAQGHGDGTTNGNTLRLTVNFTTDGTDATAASPVLVTSRWEQTDAAEPEFITCMKMFQSSVNTSLSLALSIVLAAGAGNISTNSDATRPAAIYVFDQGTSIPASGVDL